MCKWNDIAILYTKIIKVHNPHYLLLHMGAQMGPYVMICKDTLLFLQKLRWQTHDYQQYLKFF
jgi:hypothetical protein